MKSTRKSPEGKGQARHTIGTWMLLVAIFFFNTYLSMLSLTGDFDGKDYDRIVTVKRLMSRLNREDSLLAYQKLSVLFKDTIRTEAILRDYEVLVDTNFLVHLAESKSDSSFMVNVDAGIDRMICFRDMGISLSLPYKYMKFWYYYFAVTGDYIQQNNIIRLFTNILLSPLLYLSIFFLAARLSKNIAKRIVQRVENERFTIQIKNKLERSTEVIWQDLKDDLDAFGPSRVGKAVEQFISLGTKKLLSQSAFDLLILEDDNETELFQRKTDFINTWILRLGILGTLFGIMLAFYEVAKAIPLIESGKIPPIFKEKIRLALTGHAVSVITALAAQLTSVLYEIVSLGKAGLPLSRTWILQQKQYFIDVQTQPGGSTPPYIQQIIITLTNLGGELKNLGLSVNRAEASVTKLAAFDVKDLKNDINAIKGTLETIKSSSAAIKADVGESHRFLTAIRNLFVQQNITQRMPTPVDGHGNHE